MWERCPGWQTQFWNLSLNIVQVGMSGRQLEQLKVMPQWGTYFWSIYNSFLRSITVFQNWVMQINQWWSSKLGHHWFGWWFVICFTPSIIWTNAGFLLTGPLGTMFSEMLIKIENFRQKNKFEDVICKMVTLLSLPQCVNFTRTQPSFESLAQWDTKSVHNSWEVFHLDGFHKLIWVRSQGCASLVTWFCYHLIHLML